MRKLASSVAVLLALLLSFATTQPATADDSLGLGVRIENDPEATDLYMGNRLWFGIEPGEQKTRSFVITSRSEIPQQIDLYLFDKQFVNGEESVDASNPSETSEWAIFEPSSMVLEPGQEQRFTMTYQIPQDAPDLAFNSVLRVVATAAQAAEGAKDSASAVVRGAAAVELGVFLGIGDALELVPSFNIESIRGVRLPEGRFLEIELLNNGRVPIQLVGSAQLADPLFAERNFGPFEYLSREIFPDETVTAQVAMPDEVESGEWRVFITAEFGQIKQTRLFEQTLNFIPPGSQLSIWDWALRIGLITLLAVGTVVGLRLLRSKPAADPGEEIQRAKKPIKPKSPKPPAIAKSKSRTPIPPKPLGSKPTRTKPQQAETPPARRKTTRSATKAQSAQNEVTKPRNTKSSSGKAGSSLQAGEKQQINKSKSVATNRPKAPNLAGTRTKAATAKPTRTSKQETKNPSSSQVSANREPKSTPASKKTPTKGPVAKTTAAQKPPTPKATAKTPSVRATKVRTQSVRSNVASKASK